MPEYTGNEPDWVGRPDQRQCTATNRQGSRCQRWSMRGLNVCPTHGGRTPAAKAKGLERWNLQQTEKRALAQLERDGIQPLDDPVYELEKAIAEYVTLKNIAQTKVAAIQEWRTIGDKGSEQIRAELTFYEKLLDQTTKRLIELQKLGLQEKRVQINALQAQHAADAWIAMSKELFTRLRNGEPLDTLEQDMPAMARRHLLHT